MKKLTQLGRLTLCTAVICASLITGCGEEEVPTGDFQGSLAAEGCATSTEFKITLTFDENRLVGQYEASYSAPLNNYTTDKLLFGPYEPGTEEFTLSNDSGFNDAPEDFVFKGGDLWLVQGRSGCHDELLVPLIRVGDAYEVNNR